MAQVPKRLMTAVNVDRAEKRRVPSKHYVYVIEVTWDDGSETIIFRRYSKFFDLQINLLETFPREGGLKDPSTRIIPYLPGKILFRRSNIRDVALKRVQSIGEYCKDLIKLPDYIVQNPLILDFFETKPEDLKSHETDSTTNIKSWKKDSIDISQPILPEPYVVTKDYEKTQAKELSSRAGEVVEVIDKNENGWWFVNNVDGEQGWMPGVYLEKLNGKNENLVTKEVPLGQGQKYITTTQFTGGENEISFGVGVLVEVLQKNLEGWWLVSYNGNQGLAPASYLKKPPDSVAMQVSSIRKKPTITVLPNTHKGPTITTSRSCSSLSSNIVLNDNVTPNHKRLSGISAKRGSLKPQVPPPPPPIQEPEEGIYMALHSFDGNVPYGLPINVDDKVTVLSKSPGWWYIDVDGKEGWVPENYITKTSKPITKIPPNRPVPPSLTKKTQVQKLAHNKVTRSSSLREEKTMSHEFAEHTYSNDTNFRNFKKPSPPKKPQKPLLNPVNSKIPVAKRLSNEKPAIPPVKPALPASRLKPVSKSNESSPRKFATKTTAERLQTETGQFDFRSVLKPVKPRGCNGQTTKPNNIKKNLERNSQTGSIRKSPAVRQNINNNNKINNKATCNGDYRGDKNSFHLRSSPDGQVDNPAHGNETYSNLEGTMQEWYTAVCDFESSGTGELGFTEGAKAELLEQSVSDWWYVRINDHSGWVPSAFFKPVN